MDRRDVASHLSIFDNVDQKRMVGTILVEDEDGNEVEVDVNLRYEVCGTCDGRGTHVNPGIDSHGLTAEDFSEDHDFADDYFGGRYDVTCNECGGRNVVPVMDEDRNSPEVVKQVRDAVESKWRAAQERAYELRMGY